MLHMLKALSALIGLLLGVIAVTAGGSWLVLRIADKLFALARK